MTVMGENRHKKAHSTITAKKQFLIFQFLMIDKSMSFTYDEYVVHDKFMNIAIKEAYNGMNKNEGGPFGAVVVQNGKVIARAHNQVIQTNDPTSHAEIVAIRKASKKLGRFDLSDCELYSVCEPCPMCFAAIHWAKIKRLYFACTRRDAARIGFDDNYIYKVIKGTATKQQVKISQMGREKCLPLFNAWGKKPDKTQY
jgi:guanine deaminase